jgi:hypothetical protein
MRLIQTIGAGLTGHRRGLVVLAIAAAVLSDCGGGSVGGLFGSNSSDSGPSIADRFGQLFGSKSQAVGEAPPPAEQNELTCPTVAIRPGASTYAVGMPGKEASGSDLRYQATITRTARDCSLAGGQVTARIGIQGRVIAGPAGAPDSVDVPLRVAVVQDGVTPKTIFTKAYQTNVSMATDGSVVFSLVAEDVVYPVPVGNAGDAYVFYIGFDPQALKSEPKARMAKKKK